MTSTLGDSYAYCEQLARREAKNFYHAFRILPGGQRRAMCALYAFMRITDDLTDGPEALPLKRAALADWRRQLEGVLQGHYSHALHPALQDTLGRYQVPPRYLFDVLDGVEMDLEQDSYATFDELYRYCYRVASAVGLACIHIWGFSDPRALEYAESAGIAFQLTNILRDLREDAQRGRIYLPKEDLDRFGYSPDQLRQGVLNAAFHQLMQFEVERAHGYYRRGSALAPLLPPAGRAVFQVMLQTYRGLLEAIEARHYDVFSSRVTLSRWRKLSLVVQSVPVRLGWK